MVTDAEITRIHAWWRAANYLSAGQIYLRANPLLREPLRREHIKPRLLGHWGTSPGLNFCYVHLNRAIIARDQTCRYPGCNAPPSLGELHHLDWWARDGGETDINSGILLCWHHHDLVHRLRIEIRRSPTGGWLFLTRHGEAIR